MKKKDRPRPSRADGLEVVCLEKVDGGREEAEEGGVKSGCGEVWCCAN